MSEWTDIYWLALGLLLWGVAFGMAIVLMVQDQVEGGWR